MKFSFYVFIGRAKAADLTLEKVIVQIVEIVQ